VTALSFTASERRAMLVLALLIAVGSGVRVFKYYHSDAVPGYRWVRTVEESEATPPPSASAGKLEQGIDPSTATEEDLELLPGIGPGIASRIVQFRSTHGPFKKASDLLSVAGVGEHTLARISPYLRFP
jgi:competence ComEA-like helix-hairpin-helix protein